MELIYEYSQYYVTTMALLAGVVVVWNLLDTGAPR